MVKKVKFVLMRGNSKIFIGILLIFLICCQSEQIDFSSDDSSNLQNEVSTDAYSGEAHDMAHLAVGSSEATSSGREVNGRKIILTISDALKRFDCATITLETAADNSVLKPKGTITIDFGTAGCKDSKGNTRKGKILINYNGRKYNPSSSLTTTYDSYYINNAKVEGTLSVTYSNSSTSEKVLFTESLTDGKITWPDGTTSIRAEIKTIEWTRNTAEPIKDQWKITGGANYTAAGVNKKGQVYEMKIVEPLIYTRQCNITSKGTIPVKGVKELLVGSKKITSNYGDGTCDTQVTISIKGKTKVVDLKSDI
jgi:hypothetical protein